MSRSLWLLIAACLASGVDQVPGTPEGTGPAKDSPAAVTGTLACQSCPTPCEKKGCSLLDRLLHRGCQTCGHTEGTACATANVTVAKPCAQPCGKPCAPVVKKSCAVPCEPKPCPAPCVTKPCAPACPAPDKPCDCAKPSWSRWHRLLEELCEPPAGCKSCPCQQAKAPCPSCSDCRKPCSSPCPVTTAKAASSPCDKKACTMPCRTPGQEFTCVQGNGKTPCQALVTKPCQTEVSPWENPNLLLQPPAARPSSALPAAPAMSPPVNAGPIKISPYSPLPRILTKPEAVPAVTGVQVGKARTSRAGEPGRNFDAPAGRYDDVIQTSAISIAVPAHTEIARAYVSRTGCSPDYCRITGQLCYVHTEGGVWVVRYASVDREDRFGGSVVLAPLVNMDSYKEGDLVTVTGEVLNDGRRASKFLGGPLYRTTSIKLVDRQMRTE